MEFKYKKKATTTIWQEIAAPDFPYSAQSCRLHGYDLFDLGKKCSYVDTLFLLFVGELPTNQQSKLLEQLMIFLINPGPRHTATRAAMSAGISKSDHAHILPIGLIAMGGEHLGAAEVEKSVQFINLNIEKNPVEVANNLLANFTPAEEGDSRIAPGFGSRFNTIDCLAVQVASHLSKLEVSGKAFNWCDQFTKITSIKNLSWLNTGIAASIFYDFGIGAREAAGLFQLLSAPGILAHGLEQTHKPITAMPMLGDESYVIEK